MFGWTQDFIKCLKQIFLGTTVFMRVFPPRGHGPDFTNHCKRHTSSSGVALSSTLLSIVTWSPSWLNSAEELVCELLLFRRLLTSSSFQRKQEENVNELENVSSPSKQVRTSQGFKSGWARAYVCENVSGRFRASKYTTTGTFVTVVTVEAIEFIKSSIKVIIAN